MSIPSTARQPAFVEEFLKQTLPFSGLDQPALSRLARKAWVDFHPGGTMLFEQGTSRITALHIVQRGSIRCFVRTAEGDRTLIDLRGEGASFGALELFGDGRAALDVETVEDTFFICLDKMLFLELADSDPAISRHYLRTFSKGYADKALAALRQRPLCGDKELYLFSQQVGEVVRKEPLCLPFGTSIREGAREMLRQEVGSLLVMEKSGDAAGIVTDKDLRRAVALGISHDAPIETIMSAPVESIGGHESCFDALMRMLRGQIHHLAVQRGDGYTGMITSHDLLVVQGRSPLSLYREIAAQTEVQGLYAIRERMPHVARSLVEEGTRAGDVTRLVTLLSDLVLERLLTLLQKELGPPPVPFCWVLLGSEGRRESVVPGGMRNAIVYADCNDGECGEFVQRAAAIYYDAFGKRAVEYLRNCGLAESPDQLMASSERWHQPVSVWRERCEKWTTGGYEPSLLPFFDMRAGFGEISLLKELRTGLQKGAEANVTLLRHMAKRCLEARPPISIFRNLVVEKNGEQKEALDLKQRGLEPLADCVRVLAYMHGVEETNTLGRIGLLRGKGAIPEDFARDLSEAYEFILHLRLVHQLEAAANGESPANTVHPGALSEIEKKTLKDAFGEVRRARDYLKDVLNRAEA